MNDCICVYARENEWNGKMEMRYMEEYIERGKQSNTAEWINICLSYTKLLQAKYLLWKAIDVGVVLGME